MIIASSSHPSLSIGVPCKWTLVEASLKRIWRMKDLLTHVRVVVKTFRWLYTVYSLRKDRYKWREYFHFYDVTKSNGGVKRILGEVQTMNFF